MKMVPGTTWSDGIGTDNIPERIISVPYGNQPTSPINRNFLLLTKKKPRPAIDEALSEYMGFEVGRFRVYGYIIYPVL